MNYYKISVDYLLYRNVLQRFDYIFLFLTRFFFDKKNGIFLSIHCNCFLLDGNVNGTILHGSFLATENHSQIPSGDDVIVDCNDNSGNI